MKITQFITQSIDAGKIAFVGELRGVDEEPRELVSKKSGQKFHVFTSYFDTGISKRRIVVEEFLKEGETRFPLEVGQYYGVLVEKVEMNNGSIRAGAARNGFAVID